MWCEGGGDDDARSGDGDGDADVCLRGKVGDGDCSHDYVRNIDCYSNTCLPHSWHILRMHILTQHNAHSQPQETIAASATGPHLPGVQTASEEHLAHVLGARAQESAGADGVVLPSTVQRGLRHQTSLRGAVGGAVEAVRQIHADTRCLACTLALTLSGTLTLTLSELLALTLTEILALTLSAILTLTLSAILTLALSAILILTHHHNFMLPPSPSLTITNFSPSPPTPPPSRSSEGLRSRAGETDSEPRSACQGEG